MLKYILSRIFWSIPTMLVIITLAFFLMRFAPGGPFDNQRLLSESTWERILMHYHLDEPWYIQYLDYLWCVLNFDLGPSLSSRYFSVSELLLTGFPYSLKLGLYALVFGFVTGVLAGTCAALRQNTRTAYVVMSFAVVGMAIPNMVLGPILILVFALWVDWFPSGGWGEGDLTHLFLPVLTLGTAYTGAFARITRGAIIEVLRADYICTARAKGLKEHIVVWHHAMKSAMIPLVSYMGPLGVSLITGSVVIEFVFGLPGVGQQFVQGALSRDYPLVMGTMILYGTLIILANLLVDIVYVYLDPQIRLK